MHFSTNLYYNKQDQIYYALYNTKIKVNEASVIKMKDSLSPRISRIILVNTWACSLVSKLVDLINSQNSATQNLLKDTPRCSTHLLYFFIVRSRNRNHN